MTLETWAFVVEAVSLVVASLVAFFFIRQWMELKNQVKMLAEQIEQNKKALASSALSAVYQQQMNFHSHLAELPEVRKYIYSNMELPKGDDVVIKHQVYQSCEMFFDFLELVKVQAENGIIPDQEFRGFIEYAKKLYKESSSLRSFLYEHKTWYGADFSNHFEFDEDKK